MDIVTIDRPVVIKPAEAQRSSELLNPSPRSAGVAAARLVLGGIMLAHGLQKTAGLWGGHGWDATIASFGHLGVPPVLAGFAILTELVGGGLLILGYLARPAALAIAIEMVVAALLVHAKNGFFLNFEMTPGVGHGIEYNLALVGLALAVLLDGAGRLSLDAAIGRRLRASR